MTEPLVAPVFPGPLTPMPQRGTFPTNQDAFNALARKARDVRLLTRAPFDLPLWCAVGGGTKEPAILITAGAHADETSGMIAAVTLFDHVETDHILYIVPNRDPLGWEGFTKALALAADSSPPEEREGAEELLREAGEVLFEDGTFVLGLVKDLAFAMVRPTPDTFGSEKTIKMLSYTLRTQPDVQVRLQGKNVLIPANAPECDARGVLERAYTTVISEGNFIGSFNRYFGHPSAPPEVRAVEKLIDDIRPGLVVDLHEGWNDAFYLFTPKAQHQEFDLHRRIEASIAKALDKADLSTSALTELVPNMPDEHLQRFTPTGHGRLVWDWPEVHRSPYGVALMPYALQFGLAYQTEVGRWSSLERRLLYQRLVVAAAIQTFEINYG